MNIYVLNIFVPFLIFLIGNCLGLRKIEIKKFVLSSVAIYLFVFLSFFNYQTFPDIDTYNAYYSFLTENSIGELYYSSGTLMEYGYLLFNKILTFVSPNPRFLYIVRSFIFSYCIICVVKKHSCSYLVSLIFFFLLFGLNQSIFVVRQYLAISIFLLSIASILDNKVKIYFLFWLLSFSFHKSMIICLPLYWLYHYSLIKKNNVVIISCIFIIMSFFLKTAFIIVSERWGIYGDYLLNMGDNGNSAGLLIRALVIFIPFILFCRKKIYIDKYATLFFWTSLLNVVMSIVLIGVPAGSRLYSCYNSFSMLAIPYTANSIISRKLKEFYFLILLLFFSFFYFLRMSDYSYYFMWQDCNEFYVE